MRKFPIFLCLSAPILWLAVDATISDTFRRFIRDKYGNDVAKRIARDDYSAGRGSYGGGNHQAGQKTKRRPVIFVHGASTNAGTTKLVSRLFRQRGYSKAELYATSYGRPPAVTIGLWCGYAKRVRQLIEAVSAFTNSQVDIIAYSMGGPISRKAILGGWCRDNPTVNLGGSLTNTVHTYLSVAGLQRGKLACGVNCYPFCGGLPFFADINRQRHYEGQNVRALLSTGDFVVGRDVCGQPQSLFSGVDKKNVLSGMGHIGVCVLTGDLQYRIIQGTA